MSHSAASDSLLSEASSTDHELSFSASASGSGQPKGTGTRNAAPRGALPTWPATRVSPSSRSKNVSFDDRGDSTELSFTAASPSKRSTAVDPLLVVEQQHEVDMERMHRHHIRDEESALRQHIVRSVAVDKIRLHGEAQLRQAKQKEATPIDNTNAQVTPVMTKYMNHLRKAPKGNDATEKIRQERARLTEEVAAHRRTGEALHMEAMLRKKYVGDVKQSVERQEADASEDMLARKVEATQRQRELVSAAAAKKARDMDVRSKERLTKLQYRHAYVKLHGDYEHRVADADEKRIVRLADVPHKVVSHHTTSENVVSEQLRRQIAETASARRHQAEELARRQHALLTHRIQERQELVKSEHEQAAQLADEELAARKSARQLQKDADEALQRVERERERAIFLNRMSCNAEFNVELERLRQQRRQDERTLWDEKHQANAERLSAAHLASLCDKQNKGKLQTIDKLMVEEAVIVDKATRRLENRKKAQTGQEQRLLMMEAEEFNKMKVLEDIYGQRRNTVLPVLSSAVKEREQIQWTDDDHHDPSITRSRSDDREEPSNILRAREIADEEERIRKQYIATHYPKLRRVVSPRNKGLPRSLAFAPPNVLRKPMTNNPRLLELTAQLYHLERDKDACAKQTSPLSVEERCASRLRLTQRDAAQEAIRLAYDDQERLPTIHDNVPKQKGASSRLYHLPQNGDVPKPVANNDDSFTLDDDSAGVKQFVTRFYTEPLRRHEQSLASAVAKVSAQVGRPHPLRMTDKELTNVQERLFYSGTRHLSSALERKIDEREQQRSGKPSDLSDQAAVERFYTAPLLEQRALADALDEQYLR